MTVYEVEISGKITIDVCEAFPIEAMSREEAIAKAKEAFAEYIEETYSMVYECKDVEPGYVGILRA